MSAREVEEHCAGPLSQRASGDRLMSQRGRKQARTGEWTCLGWALTCRETVRSFLLWVPASPLRGADPDSVFWDLPGIIQKVGLHLPQGLPAPKSPHAIGLAKGF